MKILVYTCNICSFLSMEFYHRQYTVQWCDKCETKLRVLFLHVFNLFLGKNIDAWKVRTTPQYTFTVWKWMIRLKICTYCSLWHIRLFGIYMTPMWHYCILICFIYVMWFFNRPSALIIIAFIFEFFQIPITPGYQWWMYTVSRNATFTTTHDLVTCEHLF